MSGVIALYINGVLQTGHGTAKRLLDGNTQWTTQTNQSWSAQFYLLDESGTGLYRPVVGEQVAIYQDGVLQFAGYIDQIVEQAYEALTWLQYQCQCLGWSSICDHRVIVAQYDAGDTAVDVINDIVANGLSGEGITVQYDAVAFVLMPQPLSFNPSSVTDAFNQIVNLIGGQWWIDSSKVLHWSAVGEGSFMAVGITDNDHSWLSGTMQVTTTTQNYRNVQYVGTGAPVATQSRSQTFTADGHLFSFVLQFPINTVPTITVNGVTQTMYQLGVDPFGKPNSWYWSSDSAVIQQGQQIPPSAGSTIVVTYDSFSVSFVSEEDAAAIAAWAAIEGGSGRWENIDSQSSITDLTVAQQYAEAELENYANIPQQIQFNTYRADFVVGKQIHFNLNLHNLHGPYTVQQIQGTEVPDVPAIPGSPATTGTINNQVTVSNQIDISSYVRWFQLLLAKVTSPPLAASSSAGNAGSSGSPPTTPAAAGIQSESHVWDLGASDQTGGGGGLVLTTSFQTVAVGRINFQNSGNLIRTSVQTRVAPTGQNLVIRIMCATAAQQNGSPPCTVGSSIFVEHSPPVDTDYLVLPALQCSTSQQTVFSASPFPVTGMDQLNNASPPVSVLPDIFIIQAKYTITSMASPPVTANAQDVIVTITEQLS